ncbi:transcriptional regulator family: Fungal Specific TF [Aspergillus niger]|nr:transcriptional regulator family: Fungal Specific TF [Aspergillus niger]KAI2865658.1 transcriptional regulator family: Fungal Specific TF [Aspergillus niger]KAI2888944.1 transcriptional regulator family: Fungal Specific TF [Aspergillus niger]KAI2917752.1 transcriptional regulator family: Fungal Specific TF [Aspergillus niger]KAI2965094.1 transcriptional regulator family: Fungal Specific TF [Aspergillus niger]
MPPRRSHKKSRNGCELCKKRRVKCDEQDPCSNCLTRGTTCSYEHRPSPLSHRNGSHISVSSSGSEAIDERTRRNSALPSPRQDIYDSFYRKMTVLAWSSEWTGRDPELMHHYTLYTSRSIARRPEMQQVWLVDIPKIAYSHEFLMHGILALSALHIASNCPAEYSSYMKSSRYHITLALRSFRKALLSPTAENCCALFASSSIIMVYTFATPTEPDSAGAWAILESVIEIFKLCRGILALKSFIDSIRNSPLRPLFRQDFDASVCIAKGNPNKLFLGIENELHQLSYFLDVELPENHQKFPCVHALEQLDFSFKCIQNAELPLECGMIFIWPLSFEEEFMHLLKEMNVGALVLMAYYCAQLCVFEDYWFVGERARSLFSEISTALPERLWKWLAWPKSIIYHKVDL